MKFQIDLILGLQSHTSGTTPKGLLTKLMTSSVNSFFRDVVFSEGQVFSVHTKQRSAWRSAFQELKISLQITRV